MLGNPFDYPDSPKEAKAPESLRHRIARGYFVVCMACSQALLMILMTPLRFVMREDDVQALMPILLPMLEEGKRLAINQGMAREVAAMDGPVKVLRKLKPNYTAQCDGCAALMDGASPTLEEAKRAARDAGWDEERCLCPKCRIGLSIPQDPGVVCQTRS